jgi:hypothetical protein
LITSSSATLDQAEKLGALVGERRVRRIGRFGLVQRPVARVLDRQARGHDQHLGEAVLVAGCDDHARQAWIDRQLGQPRADRRESPLGVHRPQLREQAVTIAMAREDNASTKESLHFAQHNAFMRRITLAARRAGSPGR